MKIKDFFDDDVDDDRPVLTAKAKQDRKELFYDVDKERPWTAEVKSFSSFCKRNNADIDTSSSFCRQHIQPPLAEC